MSTPFSAECDYYAATQWNIIKIMTSQSLALLTHFLFSLQNEHP